MPKLKQLNGSYYDIPMSPAMEQHFDNPYNYTKEICEQFEHNYYHDIIPQDTRTMLDIGANVGLFALHILSLPVLSKLVCVEPTPSHFKLLEENTGLFPFVRRENVALAGHNGTVQFYWCGINTTMNSLQNRHDRSFEVNCITLDELLQRAGMETVDFCKIDIEGSEDVAITVETLKPVAERIKRIWMEVHPPNNETQDRFKLILEACGYSVEKKYHDGLLAVK